jgi:hypothetical protein
MQPQHFCYKPRCVNFPDFTGKKQAGKQPCGEWKVKLQADCGSEIAGISAAGVVFESLRSFAPAANPFAGDSV